jgi:pimeloyl-ACP methyl ester carboxylesterase
MPSIVESADGTCIGYESFGEGPPMLLVHGTSATRIRWAPVREKLGSRYTIHEMDRRGRGLSTTEANTYSLQREAEDVAAVAEALGNGVYIVAHSYGALCTIEAALITKAFRRIVLYEPPMPSPGLDVVPAETLAQLKDMADPEKILEAFYRNALQLPQEAVDAMRGTEIWKARVSAAHTIARELDAVTAYRAAERLGQITVPVRMLVGTDTTASLRAATAAFAVQIPNAEVVALQDQAHRAIDLDPDQFVRAVVDFDRGS